LILACYGGHFPTRITAGKASGPPFSSAVTLMRQLLDVGHQAIQLPLRIYLLAPAQ
jgi:hypothetical protein